MPLTREIKLINNYTFYKPLRAIFSGSSESGKNVSDWANAAKSREIIC